MALMTLRRLSFFLDALKNIYYNFAEDKFSENKFTKLEDNVFIGRNKELNDISNYLKNGNSLMVYGLRRVGKTTLIKQALDNSNVKYIYYECIKADEPTNVRLFIDTIKDKVDFPNIVFNDFLSVFNYFNKSYKDFFLVIDEYSYLKEYYLSSKKPGSMEEAIKIDSEFKTIIDEYISNNGLILCGSSISIMKNLIEYNSPLYSRFSYVLNLKQFSYIDVKGFLPSLSNKEIIEIYSVFGGSPYVLSKINPKLSLKDNVCNLLLASDAALTNHIYLNIINEFEKDSDLNIVLNCIKNGTRKYSDIEQRTSLKNGLLDKKLKKLIDLDIIEKIYPINMENESKKCNYIIKDNLLKFYYSYIYAKNSKLIMLGEDRFYDVLIEPSINEFISRRFESIVKEYFSYKVKQGYYKDIIDIGSYFGINSEFDCVLKKSNYTYTIYEVKYCNDPISPSVINQKIEQINKIKGLKVSEIGFVSASGYESKDLDINYLEIDDLFK